MISYNWELNDWMSIVLQICDNFYLISLQVLTKKKQNTRRIYQNSWSSTYTPSSANPHDNSLAPKGNNKFKSYL